MRSSLRNQPSVASQPTAAGLATAALAAAEASGSLPPLSAAERSAFKTALEHLAARLGSDTAAGPDVGLGGGEGEAEEGVAAIKPLLRDVFAAVYNLKIHSGRVGRGHSGECAGPVPDTSSPGITCRALSDERSLNPVLLKLTVCCMSAASPHDSVAAGGEQGNISLQAIDPAPDPVLAPAEASSDRAEHAAEAEFMELELTAFEPHAGRVHGGASSAGGGVAGDAPAAGDGLQVAGDAQEEDRGGADL